MPKIVISLTSYPARINTVYQVIESLFKQQKKADEIVLWLSASEFPNRQADLPDNLNELMGRNGFRIEWVKENLKSHKKYFYALQHTENITITVDDDVYYSDTMVSSLMASYRLHPHAVSARRVYIMIRERNHISPYQSWGFCDDESIGWERIDLCAIGVGGILYPPRCANAKWFDIDSIMEFAENQDDLWLKYNEIIDGIPVVYAGMTENDSIIEGSQDKALYVMNADGGANDICIKGLLKKLRKEHEVTYQEWFKSLMQFEENLFIKRKYYSNKLNIILDDKDGQDIYICGAGEYAHILYDFIKSCGKEKHIKAFLVTEVAKNGPKEDVMDIRLIRDLDCKKKFCVLCGVGKKHREELKAALKSYESHEWIDMDVTGIARLLQSEQKYGF